MAISTDYRDSRKAAYQQYAVVSDFNACKLPPHVSAEEAAPLGVAFVAAALALGICMGIDFRVVDDGPRGPDLLHGIRCLSRDAIPKDIERECFDGIGENERAKEGDWIAIWGGKETNWLVWKRLADYLRFFRFRMLCCSASKTVWAQSDSCD
jgi:NADPH:quinone reductase-like Zn-dependent oxidoreductase